MYSCCMGVFGMLGRRLGSSGISTMLANFHMCGIMLLLRAVLNMLVRNARTREPMCFRRLMFSLSGPCELFFYFVLLPLGRGL